jgi:16S rRNA (uracil1498-N3)-methyltransferase
MPGAAMRRFFCDEIGGVGSVVRLDERESSHLFKTLRARPGDAVELMDGAGATALARVSDGRTVVVAERRFVPCPSPEIHLLLASPRRSIFDQLLKQCAELGVASVTPLKTEWTVAEPGGAGAAGRWRAILIEGCKQSGNPYLPEIRPLAMLPAAVAELSARGIPAWFGSPLGGEVGAAVSAASGLAWLVGPEGGFTPAEEELMLAAGFAPLRIGRWVMRIETAALAGVVALGMVLKEKNA